MNRQGNKMRKPIIFIIIAVLLCTSGCYSLRKKFVRKKKYQKEEPVYVNFKDYPQKPSRGAYLDYYLFVKGWLDELAESLNKGYSVKREKRAIRQAVMNLEQMIGFFNEEGQGKIYPFYQDLLKVKEDIEKNPNMSAVERNSLVQKIEHFRRRFEADFKYSNAEKWMQ
jgi:predicted RND superfamily exporter protein